MVLHLSPIILLVPQTHSNGLDGQIYRKIIVILRIGKLLLTSVTIDHLIIITYVLQIYKCQNLIITFGNISFTYNGQQE